MSSLWDLVLGLLAGVAAALAAFAVFGLHPAPQASAPSRLAFPASTPVPAVTSVDVYRLPEDWVKGAPDLARLARLVKERPELFTRKQVLALLDASRNREVPALIDIEARVVAILTPAQKAWLERQPSDRKDRGPAVAPVLAVAKLVGQRAGQQLAAAPPEVSAPADLDTVPTDTPVTFLMSALVDMDRQSATRITPEQAARLAPLVSAAVPLVCTTMAQHGRLAHNADVYYALEAEITALLTPGQKAALAGVAMPARGEYFASTMSILGALRNALREWLVKEMAG